MDELIKQLIKDSKNNTIREFIASDNYKYRFFNDNSFILFFQTYLSDMCDETFLRDYILKKSSISFEELVNIPMKIRFTNERKLYYLNIINGGLDLNYLEIDNNKERIQYLDEDNMVKLTNRRKFYKQSEFVKKSNGGGTCIYTSIFSAYPKLFNNDKEILNNLISKDDNTLPPREVVNKINEDIEKRLNIKNALHFEKYEGYNVSLLTNIINLNITVNRPLVFGIYLPEYLENVGHAVEIVGMKDQNILFFENGNEFEFIEYIIKKLIDDIKKNKANEYFKDFVLTEENKKTIFNKKILNYLNFNTFEHNNYIFYELNLKNLLTILDDNILVWPETKNTEVLKLVEFSKRLQDVQMRNVRFDVPLNDPYVHQIAKEIVEESYKHRKYI